MRLLPILKPAGWDGVSRGAWAHRWLGTTEQTLAYIGYVWENGDELTYVTQTTDQFEGTETIVRQAFENLEAYPADLQVVETNGSKLVVVAGQPFSAEWALCESHMHQIHQALGCERVVVSLARRGSLLAAAWDSPEQARTTLVNLHLEAWKSADHTDAITDHLVVFDAGLKSGTLAVSTSGDVEGW